MDSDPILRLALSLHASPGTYALLVGSGISRAANIPTGWDIVMDLTRKLAALENEEAQPDPEAWYQRKFGESPNYAKLLDKLASTPAERMALLRSYFEPTEDEQQQGMKLPTPAHRAIAMLAKLGYIRMILTTNFDRLIETALEQAAVLPDVISSDDALKGAMPYVHSKCTVVKLHGDYRDTRIKNTPKELATYSRELDTLLDRVLDEFGLIVCGWSGVWDTALRDAILRCPTRRFSTFWAARGELAQEAKDIVRERRAQTFVVESADQFLSKLLEMILSLHELDRPDPISTGVAVATTKRYLSEPRYRISLYDLVRDETEKVHTELISDRFGTSVANLTRELFVARMNSHEALAERLASVLAVIGYHDRGDNAGLLTKSIERLLQFPGHDGNTALLNLRRYPALLLLYAAGVSAVAAGSYRNLAAVLRAPRAYSANQAQKRPAIEELHVWSVFDDSYRWIPRPNDREYTPANNHVLELLRPVLSDYLAGNEAYEEAFDLFEYLLALTYMDLVRLGWSPLGRFRWRYGESFGLFDSERWARSPIIAFVRAGLEQGSSWALLKAGFFNGSVDRFKEVYEKEEQWIRERISA